MGNRCDRREFIKIIPSAALATCVLGSADITGSGISSAFGQSRPPIVLASDPIPNVPVGVGKGLHPGRVVWAHDPSATKWQGPGQGHWWESDHTNQAVVDSMMSAAIRRLGGKASDGESLECPDQTLQPNPWQRECRIQEGGEGHHQSEPGGLHHRMGGRSQVLRSGARPGLHERLAPDDPGSAAPTRPRGRRAARKTSPWAIRFACSPISITVPLHASSPTSTIWTMTAGMRPIPEPACSTLPFLSIGVLARPGRPRTTCPFPMRKRSTLSTWRT